MSNKSLVTTQGNGTLSQALEPAVNLWTDHTTDPASPRRFDLIRDKFNALLGNPPEDKPGTLGFFVFTQKSPPEVTPLDVKTYQAYLESEGLAPATVYAKLSRLSSFYNWAIENDQAKNNPVESARPKAPKSYQSEKTKALSDDQVRAMEDYLRDKAEAGDVVGKRDFAIWLFLLATAARRNEILSLSWGDIRLNGTVVFTTKYKGGDFHDAEVEDPAVRDAILDYLEAAGRLENMQDDSPLWTSHDRSGLHTGKPLTSHAAARNFKRYAKMLGFDFWMHRTRHTGARIAAEEYGDLTAVQHILGHRNIGTTRIYAGKIGLKKDRLSGIMARRFGR